MNNNIDNFIGISENVINCYRWSKTVMIFALIDIFFGCFYAFYSIYFLIPLIIAFYGYYSAKNYNSSGVLFYCFYQILINIARITFSTFFYIEARKDDSIIHYYYYNWNIILSILSTFLGLYIARFSYKLYRKINKLTFDEKDILIGLNYPIRIVYW